MGTDGQRKLGILVGEYQWSIPLALSFQQGRAAALKALIRWLIGERHFSSLKGSLENVQSPFGRESGYKKMMFMRANQIQKKLSEIFAECGIAFRIVPNFAGVPVQGFIKKLIKLSNLRLDNLIITCWLAVNIEKLCNYERDGEIWLFFMDYSLLMTSEFFVLRKMESVESRSVAIGIWLFSQQNLRQAR